MLWPFSLIVGHRMVRLSVDDLVAEAVEAYKNNECIEEPPEELPVPVRKFWLFIAHFPVKHLAIEQKIDLFFTFCDGKPKDRLIREMFASEIRTPRLWNP